MSTSTILEQTIGNESLGTVRKPSLLLFLTEMPRAIYSFVLGYIFYKKTKTMDEIKNQPVLVIPGFMGSDTSTLLLRRYLSKKGFQVFGWELGRNLANLKDIKRIQEKVNELYEFYNKPVILIGWSLGGVYARHITKNNPIKTAQLITLGSPYMGVSEPNRAHLTFKLVKWGRGFNDHERKWISTLPHPVKVPSTAIYSKLDGIVSWKVCHEANCGLTHNNIEVTCGHFGMGTSKDVFIAVDQILKTSNHS
tara:strand:- start:369 stop:1121 length:753 start_codon:yes stop_codon:yes gene_type:complete